MMAVYADVNRPALDTVSLSASPRHRAVPSRSFVISSLPVVCAWMLPSLARFSRLIERTHKKYLCAVHHARHETLFTSPSDVLGETHHDGIDFSSQLFVQWK